MKVKKLCNHKIFQAVFLVVIVMVFLIPAGLTAKEIKTRTLIDMAGRKVTVTDPIERIVTTFKPASLCVLSLGLQHKFIGIDTHSKRDRLQRSVFPEVANLTGVGAKSKGINFETLVSLKPDLVILYSQKDGLSLAKRLETINIPSIVIIPETFDSIKKSLALISLAVGEEDRAALVKEKIDNVLSFIDQRLSGLSMEEKKTGYFSSNRGIFSTATGNMLQHEIFTKAGVINVSAQLTGYFQDISPEQLVKWNPQIMVLSQNLKKSDSKQLSSSVLQEISAVSHNNVFRCPSSLAPWDFPSPLSALASLWMAQKAYPKNFLDMDLEKKVDEYHFQLFGKTLTQMNGTLSDRVDIGK